MSRILCSLLLVSALVPSARVAAATAPAVLFSEPSAYFLLPLPGDYINVRYTPGSLDRSANLQHRLELVARGFDRAANYELSSTIYVLSREEWEQAGYPVAYGLPVRVGRRNLAVAALGDAGTVRLWNALLGGVLPQVSGAPLRGSPQEAATLVLTDLFTQLLLSEILVDDLGIAGDAHWVRGLTSHLAFLDAMRRFDPQRMGDLDAIFGRLAEREGNTRPFSARDYGPDLELGDWLWFQAQLHRGARILLDKEGKGSLKKMKKLTRRDKGVLEGETLLRKYKALEAWFRESFSAVSFR
jgi:hypothetical protein